MSERELEPQRPPTQWEEPGPGVDRPAFDSGPAALGLRECPPPACSWKGGWDTAGDVGNVPTTQQHLVIASCGDSCGLNFLKTSFCFSKGLQI